MKKKVILLSAFASCLLLAVDLCAQNPAGNTPQEAAPSEDEKSFTKEEQLCRLFSAVTKGNLTDVKFLLEHGADVNVKGVAGTTALHIAAEYLPGADVSAKDKLDLCKYLIDHGADVNAKINNCDSIEKINVYDRVSLATESSFLITLVLKHGIIIGDITALHIAALNGNLDLCKYLIDHGADVKAKRENGPTALHLAAWNGNLELCKYLIDHGADAKDSRPAVLDFAAYSGNLELCKYLVEHHGADVNAKGIDKTTVLHIAAERGNLALCKYLLEHGADINAQTKRPDDPSHSGYTPLHLAAKEDRYEVCKLLLESGADVSIREDDGSTALREADRGSRTAELLWEYEAKKR